MSDPTPLDPQADGPRGVHWTRRRQQIDAMLRGDGRPERRDMADLYGEALRLLEGPETPGCRRLVTHAVREIARGLPRALAHEVTGKSRVEYAQLCTQLSERWDSTCPADWKLGASHPEVAPDATVDLSASLALEVRALLAAHSVGRLTHKDKTKQMFRAIAPDGEPHAGREALVAHWMEVAKWFVDKVHIGSEIRGDVLKMKVAAFEGLLGSIAAPFFETMDEIDELLHQANSSTKPTPELVERARERLTHPQAYRYFFEKLRNPHWVEPLQARGFFAHPPPPAPDGEGGTIHFPDWPELSFLERMAEEGTARGAVLDVILQFPPTRGNDSVRSDVLRIALSYQAAEVAPLAKRARKWAGETLYLTLPRAVADLAVHLLKGGRADDALALARALLVPLADSRASTPPLRPEPKPRFSIVTYRDVLDRVVMPLASIAPLPTLKLVAFLMQQALFLSSPDGTVEREDYSFIWRANLTDDYAGDRGGVREALATGLRATAEAIVEEHPDQASSVIHLLRSGRWTLFTRLALHVARQQDDVEPVRTLLLDEELWHSSRVRLEYHQLLQAKITALSDADQRMILDLVESGRPASEAEGFEADQWKMSCERWKRDRLWLMRSILSPESAAELADLESRHGPARSPDHPITPVRMVRTGPNSPLDQDALTSMGPAEVAAYLRGWVPSSTRRVATTDGGTRDYASPEGLGRELQKVVADQSERYLAEASRFKGTEATYARAVLRGLEAGLANVEHFEWHPVLALCEWVVQEPRSLSDSLIPQTFDRDPHWGWARQSAIDFISAALKQKKMPLEARERVWSVIASVLKDPDPTPEHEDAFGGGGSDSLTVSLNTVRPRAMHTAIRYGLWFRADGTKTLSEIPELKAALESHLDHESESSRAVRSVYGQWLPQLFLLDSDWSRKNLKAIFPTDPSQADLRKAAWDAYITCSGVYDSVFSELTQQYAAAVEYTNQRPPDERQWRDADDCLGEHIMLAYGRGLVGLEAGGLVDLFFRGAAQETKRHAVAFVGYSLNNADDVPADVPARFVALWELWRDEQPVEVIRGFGSWYASRRFELTWTLKNLSFVLEKSGGRVDADQQTIEQMERDASEAPSLTARCLDQLIRGHEGNWRLYSWRDHIRAILESALKDGAAGPTTRALIHWLGERGYTDYRDLST